MKIRIKNPIWGVPITFLDKYNPEQFEIIGMDLNDSVELLGIKEIGDAWIRLYRKQGGKGHITSKMHSLVYTHNGKAVSLYRRILIRRKTNKTVFSMPVSQYEVDINIFDVVLKEVKRMFEEKLYFSALMIVLTFPDICGNVEYPEFNKGKSRYIKWVIENLGVYECPDDPESYAKMIYELRCALVHAGEGYRSVNFSENNNEHPPVNEFCLQIPSKKLGAPCIEKSTTSHFENGKETLIKSNSAYNLDIVDFISKIIKIVEHCYNNNKEKFSTKNVVLLDFQKEDV